MEYTTNYEFKKPEATDQYDIDNENDNMDAIDTALKNLADADTTLGQEKLGREGDSKDVTTTFTSSDVADGSATAWTTVTALATGEKHSSIFAKLSQMFKNVRYLYKMLGTTDISSIGDGTVTDGISQLNSALASQATKVDDAFKHSSYVNFPSGLKMCWGILGSWDNNTQKNYRYNDLPITFTATPIVFCTPYGQAAQAQNYYYTYEYLHAESTYNKIKVLPYWTSKANPSSFGKSDDNFFYLAIGY